MKRPINIDSFFNKKRFIEYIIEVNIYYQTHKETMKINVIISWKQSVILGILWLAHQNSEINWRTEKVKIIRYPEECRKQ